MSAQKLSVNLLPPSEFELSFWGRFLKWAVTAGRYIIILVELVVILAFLSRFKLDEDLRSINEQIGNQINFLDSQDSELQDFLRIQKKINQVDKFIAGRVRTTDTINYLESRKPEEITIRQLAVSKGETTLTASTFSEAHMGNMMIQMSRDGIWKSLDMTQIMSDPDVGIKFTLVARK